MALLAAAAAVQGAVGLAQGIGGALMKNKRPEFADDTMLQKYIGVEENRYRNPFAEYDKAREGIAQSVANVTDDLIRRNAGATINAGALGGAVARGNVNLEIAKDRAFRSAADRYGQALRVGQRYNERKWDWEKAQPYRDKAAAKSALLQSGISNVAGAATMLGQGALLEKMYGGGKGKMGAFAAGLNTPKSMVGEVAGRYPNMESIPKLPPSSYGAPYAGYQIPETGYTY